MRRMITGMLACALLAGTASFAADEKEGVIRQRQENQQGQSGQAAQGQSQGSKTLTTEQRTTIRNTVVSKGPRATNVNFSVSVGTTVPTSVRVVAVPSTLIEIYPEWRGHMYFIVNDEIIIVDSRHRIIAVLPV